MHRERPPLDRVPRGEGASVCLAGEAMYRRYAPFPGGKGRRKTCFSLPLRGEIHPMVGDWDAYRVLIDFEAEGAADGGTATAAVQVWYTMGDQEVCLRTLVFESTYTYGGDQSDHYYGWVDESIEFESGSTLSHDCPVESHAGRSKQLQSHERRLHFLEQSITGLEDFQSGESSSHPEPRKAIFPGEGSR